MKRPMFTPFLAAAAAASLACTHVHHSRPFPRTARVTKTGPPPHAPAHGYRHKHHAGGMQLELVFDSGLGVYLVVGRAGHYYAGGHFYRQLDGAWYVSDRLDADWARSSHGRLPPGLAKKKAGRGKRNRGGSHPAKPAKRDY